MELDVKLLLWGKREKSIMLSKKHKHKIESNFVKQQWESPWWLISFYILKLLKHDGMEVAKVNEWHK